MRLALRILPLILALAGCAGAPTPPVAPSTRPAIQPAAEAAPAYEALARGDYQAAATQFDKLAAGAKPPLKQEYQLSAVAALLQADLVPQASELLAQIEPTGMDARSLTRMQLLEARLALKRRDAEHALAVLAGPRTPATDPVFLAEYHHLRGLSYQQLGNMLEAAREWVTREPYLAAPQEITENQRALWEALSQLPEAVLLAMQTEPAPDVFSGWMELARIGKAIHTERQLEAQLARWREIYPSHPAGADIFAKLRQRSSELVEPPARIALLLPFTGNYRDASAAVRDGILTAHFANPANQSVRIRSYDVGTEPQTVLAAYGQAVSEGADFVIGPLTKEGVDVLARQPDLPVPTLALNYADVAGPRNLFQFGLPPEDEARQVADRAWLDGMNRAAIVIPEGPWGTRMAQAFGDHWKSLGGTVVTSVTYPPQENDFSGPLRQLLNLDDSQRRHHQVEATLGRSLDFQPRRRQDIDFVFLAAFPRQARLLRPQLNFHHATDLPVYGTSHLFNGSVTPDLDRDMDGVLFGDMPWVLENLQPAALHHDGQLRRLVALGADAYGVVPFLRMLKNRPGERYEGSTGSLHLDDENRVHRELAWARFAGGRPRTLGNTPAAGE